VALHALIITAIVLLVLYLWRSHVAPLSARAKAVVDLLGAVAVIVLTVWLVLLAIGRPFLTP
jgi:multisubunit Na+/H+ antiporter MnhB subunit